MTVNDLAPLEHENTNSEEKELAQCIRGRSWVSTTRRRAGWGVLIKMTEHSESQKEEIANVQTPRKAQI